MRSLGWALIQCDWFPYKTGQFGHRRIYKEGYNLRLLSLLHCKRILYHLATIEASLVAQMVKNLPTVQETWV